MIQTQKTQISTITLVKIIYFEAEMEGPSTKLRDIFYRRMSFQLFVWKGHPPSSWWAVQLLHIYQIESYILIGLALALYVMLLASFTTEFFKPCVGWCTSYQQAYHKSLSIPTSRGHILPTASQKLECEIGWIKWKYVLKVSLLT